MFQVEVKVDEPKDSRRVFRATDLEFNGESLFTSRIDAATERASREVDRETIVMFKSRGLPLPPRLAKFNWVVERVA